MNADSARAEIFGDSLACEETRPAAFVPGELGANAARDACLRAESLLRALAVIEDSRVEDSDERTAADLALSRIEAKVDLLTALVAGLSKRHEHEDPLRPLQWSALGACLRSDDEVAPGTAGGFRIQPSDWLPQSLLLPATVVATFTDGDGRQTWLRFAPQSPALTAALERHLFRVHRRAIAEQRRPR
ncbi:PilZ domain-containing protein [Lysobacter sp. D1-1-M9]|uniref:PilZ domain-containing protein n=1 Tax=Novilysobacter longmucuonensis TaxID=3098603 RepID=UPI002FC892D4